MIDKIPSTISKKNSFKHFPDFGIPKLIHEVSKQEQDLNIKIVNKENPYSKKLSKKSKLIFESKIGKKSLSNLDEYLSKAYGQKSRIAIRTQKRYADFLFETESNKKISISKDTNEITENGSRSLIFENNSNIILPTIPNAIKLPKQNIFHSKKNSNIALIRKKKSIKINHTKEFKQCSNKLMDCTIIPKFIMFPKKISPKEYINLLKLYEQNKRSTFRFSC